MKYIGVVGSRRRNSAGDKLLVWEAINKFYEDGDVLVSGGCEEGADKFADEYARFTGVPILTFYPSLRDVEAITSHFPGSTRLAHTKANYARNGKIAGKVTVLIACVTEDRKGGTENTVKEFTKRAHKEPELQLYLVRQKP